jgi:hypothetical protein
MEGNMKLTKLLLAAVVGMGLAGPSAAATQKLAFALDESGSVSNSEFNQLQNGLANALGQIPTDGTYEITVVTFASSARIQSGLSGVVIDSAAALSQLQTDVRNLTNLGGGTNIQSALDVIAGQNIGDDLGLINVVTDGRSSTFSNDSVKAAGWDSLSFEAVTSSADTTLLVPEAFAGTNEGGVLIPSGGAIPDPRNQGFVLEVAGFDDFENAIGSKVSAIVDQPPVIPLPAGLPLLLTGIAFIGGLRATKRRKAA